MHFPFSGGKIIELHVKKWTSSERLMSRNLKWGSQTCLNSSQEHLRNIIQFYIGPLAGIEPTPLRCRCNALSTKIRRWLTRASVIHVYLGW